MTNLETSDVWLAVLAMLAAWFLFAAVVTFFPTVIGSLHLILWEPGTWRSRWCALPARRNRITGRVQAHLGMLGWMTKANDLGEFIPFHDALPVNRDHTDIVVQPTGESVSVSTTPAPEPDTRGGTFPPTAASSSTEARP